MKLNLWVGRGASVNKGTRDFRGLELNAEVNGKRFPDL